MEWYCVFTKRSEEVAANRYLQELLGLETYYPRLKRQKTIRRVRRWVISSLFPRYLFCRLNRATHQQAARYAPHVVDLVQFGERPTVVDDSIIEELKRWAGDEVDVVTLRPELRPGDAVEIVEGPLRGLQALFQQKLGNNDRVAVLLATLSFQPRIVLDRSQIAVAV